jgi:hypothetical protein
MYNQISGSCVFVLKKVKNQIKKLLQFIISSKGAMSICQLASR